MLADFRCKAKTTLELINQASKTLPLASQRELVRGAFWSLDNDIEFLTHFMKILL